MAVIGRPRNYDRQVDFTVRIPIEQMEFIERFQKMEGLKKRAEATRRLLFIAQAATEL